MTVVCHHRTRGFIQGTSPEVLERWQSGVEQGLGHVHQHVGISQHALPKPMVRGSSAQRRNERSVSYGTKLVVSRFASHYAPSPCAQRRPQHVEVIGRYCTGQVGVFIASSDH